METKNSDEQRFRQHMSREEKQRHLDGQSASGLSVAAYCREHGLGYGNFMRWQRQAVKAITSFRPMELVANNSDKKPLAEFKLNGGQTLVIHFGCSEPMAIAMIKALI